MPKKITTYEKGLALEVYIAELFKKKGYYVIHNAKRKGRSGTEHQLDILAEYSCPLHTSRLIVEAKSYETPIDKDRIMKLIQTVDDLGAEHGIIVTTSYFTPGAITTAEGRNIDLWDRVQLAKLLGEAEISTVESGLVEKIDVAELVVQPRFGLKEIKTNLIDRIEKRAKGGLLGIGRVMEKLESIELMYHPYYEAEMLAEISETRQVGWIKEETVTKTIDIKVNADAVTGELITCDGNGISYPYEYLGTLDTDEISALRIASQNRKLSLEVLLGLGYSEGKARRMLKSLSGKGVIRSPARRGFPYTVNVSFPHDPQQLQSISAVHKVQESGQGITKTREVAKDASAIIKALESYWTGASVKKIKVIYYPYFVSILVAEDGSRRIETLDAITNIINESLRKRFLLR